MESVCKIVFQQEEDEERLLGMGTTSLLSRLQLETIMDILSRLPTKTLSQCRWVSKSWYNLIKHRPFTLLQHTIATQSNSESIIFETYTNTSSSFPIDHEIFNLPLKTVLCLPPRIYYNENCYKIVGSCNGLICFKPNSMKTEKPITEWDNKVLPYYIFNPITGDKTSLPISQSYNYSCDYVSGFGFDPESNLYKVVRIIETKLWVEYQAEVFTLGSDSSWRPLSRPPYFLDDYDFGNKLEKNNVFVGGSLHWLGYINSCRFHKWGFDEIPRLSYMTAPLDTPFIISFNVATEEFQEIILPFEVGYIGMQSTCLVVLEKRLCFIDAGAVTYSDLHQHVWVMEEYGVQDSWREKYVIRTNVIEANICGSLRERTCDLIKLTKNGMILLLYGKEHLGYYDPQRALFTPISVQENHSFWTYVSQFVHVESLISPSHIATSKKRESNSFITSGRLQWNQQKDVGEAGTLMLRKNFQSSSIFLAAQPQMNSQTRFFTHGPPSFTSQSSVSDVRRPEFSAPYANDPFNFQVRPIINRAPCLVENGVGPYQSIQPSIQHQAHPSHQVPLVTRPQFVHGSMPAPFREPCLNEGQRSKRGRGSNQDKGGSQREK